MRQTAFLLHKSILLASLLQIAFIEVPPRVGKLGLTTENGSWRFCNASSERNFSGRRLLPAFLDEATPCSGIHW
jgi:hypothetical protein